MNNKKIKIFIIAPVILAAAVFLFIKIKPRPGSEEITEEINPSRGRIQKIISTTGTVLPKNRLEIKPPVGGRVETILVKEGDDVKTGQTLAWMSSTERATLLDAARGQGEEQLKYWEDAYKPIALLAPIYGEVIVATTQPGQTVATSDAVVVLSDRLIVRAQVDETDIGKIKIGQRAIISLDAYPDAKIKSEVNHIYYESKTVNNVTIYEADLMPQELPDFFRSGMNAAIDFVIEDKDGALLIPLEALHKDKEGSFVMLRNNGQGLPVEKRVKTGIIDAKNAEVISGLGDKDRVIVKRKKYSLPKKETTSNPFMPFRQRSAPARR